jgi:hypothetical protein
LYVENTPLSLAKRNTTRQEFGLLREYALEGASAPAFQPQFIADTGVDALPTQSHARTFGHLGHSPSSARQLPARGVFPATPSSGRQAISFAFPFEHDGKAIESSSNAWD